MTAIDTNILVRVVVHDEPVQTEKALALLANDTVFIPVTVILETEWVLRYCYDLQAVDVVRVFRALARAPGVTIESGDAVTRAVDMHADGMDFADALHVVLARRASDRFCTFDKHLAQAARRQAVPGVVWVGT